MAQKTYTVTHGTINHGDTIYQVGDTINLDDATAKQLAIHLEPAKPAPAPGESTDG